MRIGLPRPLRIASAALLALLLVAYAFVVLVRPVHTAALPVDTIRPRDGASFIAPAPLPPFGFENRSDSMTNPQLSRARLLENGAVIGPMHASHADIASVGYGRFSHWDNHIVFSASDNSDPRTNGRTYAMTYVMRVPLWLHPAFAIGGVLFLWLSGAFGLLRRLAKRWGGLSNPWPYLVLASALAIALMAVFALRPTIVSVLTVKDISARTDSAYATPAPTITGPLYQIVSDAGGSTSSLTMLENGRELSGRHALHRDIEAKGEGRYSHWGDQVYFSTSDNTDPRTNGRSYTLRVKPTLPVEFWAPLAFLIAAFGLRGVILLQGRHPRLRGIIGRACFGIAVGAAGLAVYDVWTLSGFYPALSDDSASYIVMPGLRGYVVKMMLEGGSLFNAGPVWIVALQLTVYIAATFAMGWAVGRASNATWAGWLVTALLVVDNRILDLTIILGSEPIFLAFLLCHMAFALEALRSGKTRDFAISAGFAALAILVRPVGLGLIPGLIATLLMMKGRRLRHTLTGGATLASIVLAGSIPNMLMYGSFSTHALGGMALLGHVVHFADSDASYPDREFADVILKSVAGMSTADGKPYPGEYAQTTADEYNGMLWGAASPAARTLVRERLGQTKKSFNEDDVQGLVDDGMRKMATAIVADHPGEYARHVAAHVYTMWTMSFTSRFHSERARWAESDGFVDSRPELIQMMRSNGDYPPEQIRTRWAAASQNNVMTDNISDVMYAAFRTLIFPVALGSLTAIGWALVLVVLRRPVPLQLGAAAFISVQLWCYVGIVAAAQPALARYTAVNAMMIVPLILMGTAGIVALLQKAPSSRLGDMLRRREKQVPPSTAPTIPEDSAPIA